MKRIAIAALLVPVVGVYRERRRAQWWNPRRPLSWFPPSKGQWL